jgi:hypothetical protein
MLQRPPQGINGPPVMAMCGQLNFEQVCSILSKVTGKQINYRQVEHGVMANCDKIVGAHMVSFKREIPFNSTHANTTLVRPQARDLFSLTAVRRV